MSNVKRYYSFLLGIIAASVTWSVVLYLYVKLGNDFHTNFIQKDVSSNFTLQNSKEKQAYKMSEDAAMPYDNDKSSYYQRKKYYKNSEKLIKQLQPVVRGMNNLGKFLNIFIYLFFFGFYLFLICL